jgi:hypothetical protein
VKLFYLYLALPFIFFCYSVNSGVNSGLVENESQKKFEGFISDNTFQVHCSISVFQNNEKSKRRDELLERCKNHLVTLLAEFKIAYDYNIKNSKFHNQNQYMMQAKKEKDSTKTAPAKITNLSQISIDWKVDKIKQLREHYNEYLPGQIFFEWVEKDKEYFLYRIRKSSLMNELKNNALPFGVEF